MQGEAAVEVSKTSVIFTTLVVNFNMITSAASTPDSTFSSERESLSEFSKMEV